MHNAMQVWRTQPVFRVQCQTEKRAAELGLTALRIRALKPLRSRADQIARDALAKAVKLDRLLTRFVNLQKDLA